MRWSSIPYLDLKSDYINDIVNKNLASAARNKVNKDVAKKKISKDKINELVHDSLDKVGLPQRQSSYPLQLSGGEQQRVCIARALVKKPKIILADEPTGNLDPNISDEILDLLEICTDNGATVLMSTHNFPLIQPRKKKFIELNKGRLVT